NEAWTTDLKATGLSAEPQYIQIKDKLECTGSVLVDLEEPAPLKTSINSIDSVSCFEGNSGAIHLTGSGGNVDGDYFVSTDKSSWETGTDIENLSAGEYTFYMRDEKNCMDSIVNTIPQPAALQTNPTTYHLACFNDNSGAVKMNTDGGNGRYLVSVNNLEWNDGDSLGQLPALTNHTIYVKDWKNCLTTREINISQPPLLTASTDTIEHILCHGDATGSIRININGGTPNYEVSSDSVHWMKGKYLENLSANDNLKVYVRDMNECVAVHTDMIQQPEFPLATNIQSEYHLRCHNDSSGAIKLNISGGTFPYRVSSDNDQWTLGDSLALLPAGVTGIYVLDKNNCQSYETTTLAEPEALSFSIDTVMEAWCDQSNATIDISVMGGTVSNDYSYEWQYIDSNQFFVAKDLLENIYSGLYAVGITDDNACYVTDTIAVSEQDGPKLNAWHFDSTSCHGKADGVVYIDNVSGGFGAYTYTLNGQAVGAKIANLPAGNYLFKVTDENNCAENRILEIPQPAPFDFNEEILQPTCFGNTDGSIKISPEGGSGVIDATWGNGHNGFQLTNTGEGMYNVRLTDAHNCIAEKTFEIKQPLPLTVTARIDAVLCAGSNDGMIAANALGGNGTYSYQWEGGSNANTLSQLKSDTYHLKVTDKKNCELDTSFYVSSPLPLSINETIIHPACFGDANGSISATFEGGTGTIQHWWSTGSTATSIDGLPQGSYSVNLRDKNNCTSTKKFTLQHPQPLSISEELHNPVCNGDNNGFIQTQVSGGNGEYTYLWDNGTETADAIKLTSGEHTLTVTDLKNCAITKSFVLTHPDPVLINGSITPPLCYNSTDGKIEVTAQGGHGEYNYEWSNLVSQSIITKLGEGEYTVTATDMEGCTGSKTFEIIPPVPPTANLDQYPGVL
ncbi:MAG: SprB repeat-containing protein, partial [Bacteroidales bacterium]|nr:SprB repeat-containing protein [Bacteroidales bacterium]